MYGLTIYDFIDAVFVAAQCTFVFYFVVTGVRQDMIRRQTRGFTLAGLIFCTAVICGGKLGWMLGETLSGTKTAILFGTIASMIGAGASIEYCKRTILQNEPWPRRYWFRY